MTDIRALLTTWAEQHDNDPHHPTIPAATVVVVRDGAEGIDTLMLRKNSKLSFGGMWVFPGGRIDAEDYLEPDDLLAAAKQAAVREAVEEADQHLQVEKLAWFSHWTPPTIAPKRFATWFFIALATSETVQIDGGEIHESCWMSARSALRRVDQREIEIAPPTWVTLHDLTNFDSASDAIEGLSARTPRFYVTRALRGDDGPVAVWEGDAAYESGELTASGPRHRLSMAEGGFRFENDVH